MLSCETSTITTIDLRLLLENMPINESTIPILDEFCKKYAEYRSDIIVKPIIEKALSGELYYVLWRTKFTGKELKDCGFKNLIKPFASEEDAIKWIHQNGHKLVYEYQMDGGFLYIQKINHEYASKGIFYNNDGMITSAFNEVETNEIFAFYEDDYEILLNEHITRFVLMDNISEYPCIPYWIHYIGDNNNKIGLNEEYGKKLYYTFKINGASEDFLDEFKSQCVEFSNDPNSWIKKYVDGNEELLYYDEC